MFFSQGIIVSNLYVFGESGMDDWRSATRKQISTKRVLSTYLNTLNRLLSQHFNRPPFSIVSNCCGDPDTLSVHTLSGTVVSFLCFPLSSGPAFTWSTILCGSLSDARDHSACSAEHNPLSKVFEYIHISLL